jgi:hypothetical protein
VVTDLTHTCSTPALDARDWTVLEGSPTADEDSESSSGAVCIAIDIVDEQHSLGLAMRRLARDERLRRDLGERAREYWKRHHTLQRMAEDYERVIERALHRPAPDRSRLPAHLLDDGTGLAGRIVAEFGLSLDTLDWRSEEERRR